MRQIYWLLFSGVFFAVSGSQLLAASKVDPTCPETPESQFFARGDFLYWVPEASGLSTNFGSGSSTKATVAGVSQTTSTETDLDPSFNWDPGFRISAGFQFDCDLWDVNAIWTYFHGNGHKAINQGNWDVKLNQLDLAAFYNASPALDVTVGPVFGVRGTSIRQKLYSKIITNINYIGTGVATDTRIFQDREQFYGLGPLFGLTSTYDINSNFSLYGSVTAALLYGSYHLNFNDSEVVTAPATPSQISSTVNKRMYAFDFNSDLAVGVQWQDSLGDGCDYLLKLGLENHQYFDQSRIGSNWGNLSFSGFIASLTLIF